MCLDPDFLLTFEGMQVASRYRAKFIPPRRGVFFRQAHFATSVTVEGPVAKTLAGDLEHRLGPEAASHSGIVACVRTYD